jgi:hypothetical protein
MSDNSKDSSGSQFPVVGIGAFVNSKEAEGASFHILLPLSKV